MSEIIFYEEEVKNVNSFLNTLRGKFDLPPKTHTSNFIFKDKRLEIAHIIRMSCDEMFQELESMSCDSDKSIKIFNR